MGNAYFSGILEFLKFYKVVALETASNGKASALREKDQIDAMHVLCYTRLEVLSKWQCCF